MSEIERITSIVINKLNDKRITIERLLGKSRNREYVMARAIIYKITRQFTVLSIEKIGLQFNRTHATVLNGIIRLNEAIDTYPNENENYMKIRDECEYILTNKPIQLKRRYESVVSDYVDMFCKKHDIQFDYWVADKVGQIGMFGDYYFDFNDIVLDINESIPVGLILEWHNKGVEFSDKKINFYSYSKGLRFEHLE